MSNNLQDSCRICLDVDSVHISISQNPTVHLHMKSCLDMTVSAQDNLPKQICETCVSRLREFYNFKLNARYSLDWLEYSLQEKTKNLPEGKMPLQPLPDSEYNSDSLLEFLNNNENIEDYLNTIGKDDIPSMVGILDKHPENSTDTDSISNNKSLKLQDENKNKSKTDNCQLDMEIDVLDSEVEVVQEILTKEVKPKNKLKINSDTGVSTCAACKVKFSDIDKLSQHLSTCDKASRTCIQCNILFDSKLKMQQHCAMHRNCWSCFCGKQFQRKDLFVHHHKNCHPGNIDGYGYRCKQCNQLFTDRFLLYRHARSHVKKADLKMCDICGLVLYSEVSLVMHRRRVHNTTDTLSYRCKACTFSSADRKEIYSHIYQQHLVHGGRNQHLCETCGQSFATSTTLMRHSLQHGNLRYACSVCEERFSSKGVRDEHVTKHSEMIFCEKCGLSVSCKLPTHVCAE